MTFVHGLIAQVSERMRGLKGTMSSRPRLFHAVVPAIAFLLLTTGCPPAMSTQSDSGSKQHVAPNEFPLKFFDHSFEPHCYNTLTCTVIYNQYNFNLLNADKPSGPPRSSDYRDDWWPASHIGIRNFPSPAEVRWTSMDGVAHEAKVDMSVIFKHELVLYNVPNAEIADGIFPQGIVGGPSIFLEVNDRTINVYMAAFIPTTAEQIPGNRDSNARTDLVLAWTHTY
ncbi:hypothetical protein [Rhodanobacter lindaniclasticus]